MDWKWKCRDWALSWCAREGQVGITFYSMIKEGARHWATVCPLDVLCKLKLWALLHIILKTSFSLHVMPCYRHTWSQPLSPRTPWERSCRSCEGWRLREQRRIPQEEAWSGHTLLVCWWRCCSWPPLFVAAEHPDLDEHCCGLCTKELQQKSFITLMSHSNPDMSVFHF